MQQIKVSLPDDLIAELEKAASDQGRSLSETIRMRLIAPPSVGVHDAKSGDIYVDGNDRLWRCVKVRPEPTVTMEEVEGPSWRDTTGNRTIKERCEEAINSVMWKSWKRIWRKEARASEERT